MQVKRFLQNLKAPMTLLIQAFIVTSAHGKSAEKTQEPVLFSFEIDKSNLGLTLTTSLQSLVGFNQRPATDEQKAAFDKAMLVLRNPDLFLSFGKESGCQLRFISASLDLSERRIAIPPGEGGTQLKNPDAGEIQESGTGGTVTAEYTGTCEKPKGFRSFGSSWFKLFEHGTTVVVELKNGERTTRSKPVSKAPELTLSLPQ